MQRLRSGIYSGGTTYSSKISFAVLLHHVEGNHDYSSAQGSALAACGCHNSRRACV